MIVKTSYFVPSRRQFLLNALPAGTLFSIKIALFLLSRILQMILEGRNLLKC
jgi:hypothetical protein